MRQIPRIPAPTFPTKRKESHLDAETRAVLADIRRVLEDSEAQSKWAHVDMHDPTARD